MHREKLVHWWVRVRDAEGPGREGGNSLGDTRAGSLPVSFCPSPAWVLIGLPSKIPSFSGRLLKDGSLWYQGQKSSCFS